MALKTGKDYVASLKKMKTVVYVNGEKLKKFWEHPLMIPAINTVAAGYDLANDPNHADISSATSHLTGGKINRFIFIANSREELLKRQQQIKLCSFRTGQCVYQCTGTDALNAVAPTTFEIDEALGTDYKKRFDKWLTYIHENDLTVSGALTDVKGVRTKRQDEQASKDLYLRVVEKKKDGIVVRGAKIFQSGAAVVHEHLCVPTQAVRAGAEEYAVVFAVPSDAEGVIHIHQFAPADAIRMIGEEIDFGNVDCGAYSAQIIIFDNVFVPWERVFLCGETQFTATLVERFGRIHRCVSSACTSGWIDLFTGVAANCADYNGTSGKSHIKDKIAQLVFMSNRAFSCGVAAAMQGQMTPSGYYLPDQLTSNVAKLDGALAINEARRLGGDICGGLSAVLPMGKDFSNPEIGGLLKEFLGTSPDVPVEDRFRMNKLANHLFVGSGLVESKINGSGPSEVQKVVIYQLADLEFKKKAAQRDMRNYKG